MAEQVTTIRLDTATLSSLREVADIFGESVAGVIRLAVSEYLDRVSAEPGFEERALAALADRKNRVKELMGRVRRDEPDTLSESDLVELPDDRSDYIAGAEQ